MELKDRIAAVRRAAGLTQEQLGELLGVSRQAVSRWESGQTSPDVSTLAALCEQLHVSADYVLLGKEPETQGAGNAASFQRCPLCGEAVFGNSCPQCGYVPGLSRDDDGKRYALVTTAPPVQQTDYEEDLLRCCGIPREDGRNLLKAAREANQCAVLRRGLKKQEVRWLAGHMRRLYGLRIVEDRDEEAGNLPALPSAMELPPAESAERREGIGFWGVVGAVVVALLILSFF